MQQKGSGFTAVCIRLGLDPAEKAMNQEITQVDLI